MTETDGITKEALNDYLDDKTNIQTSRSNQIDFIMKTQERTLLDKLFSKMHPGCLRASIFNLSILSIGAGCLALPQRFMQLSILVGVIVVIIAEISAFWTLQIIIEAGRKKGLTEHSKVILEYCGYRWSIFGHVTIIVCIFGYLIVYQIIGKFKYFKLYLS